MQLKEKKLRRENKKIGIEYDEAKMALFLRKLVFITNYHNENSLDILINWKFNEKFHLLNANFVKSSFQNDIINFLKMYQRDHVKFLTFEKEFTTV